MDIIPQTIFREYPPKEAFRSDRSAGDRARHRQKVKQSIKDNISDILSDESIIGKSGDKVIKVPIKGLKEWKFVYGDGDGDQQVSTGDGNAQPGQIVGKKGQGQGQGPGKGDKAGDQAGQDIYETEITLDELTQYLLEELALPNLKKTNLKEIIQKSKLKKDGYRKVGIQVRLDKRKTARQRIKRKKAMSRHVELLEDCPDCNGLGYPAEKYDYEENVGPECISCEGTGKVDKRIRFRNDDRFYKHMTTDPKPQSNAAIIFIMDVSGSMDNNKKFLARSFFYLFYLFIRAKYDRSELVFVSHHTEAKEVTEDEFFHKGESGGTFISTGLEKALNIINERYNPSIWNNYAFYLGDGDNFDSDNTKAVKVMRDLIERCQLVGYGEIKPNGSRYYEGSMINEFKKIDENTFKSLLIEKKEDIWLRLKEFLSIED